MSDVTPWQANLLELFLQWSIRFQTKRSRDQRAFPELLPLKSLSGGEEQALRRVVQMRRTLADDRHPIAIQDYGTGGSSGWGGPVRRSVSSIYRSSAIPHWWGIFLFRLVRALRPKIVLELGTNLGVSAAYIRSGLDLNGDASIMTSIEGDPALAKRAGRMIGEVCQGNVEIAVGRFADVLPHVLSQLKMVDLVFIDGHHEFEPTLRYFEMLRPHLSRGGTVIFDDIYLWSRPVRNAWKEIIRNCGNGISFDFAKLGVLFPDGRP